MRMVLSGIWSCREVCCNSWQAVLPPASQGDFAAELMVHEEGSMVLHTNAQYGVFAGRKSSDRLNTGVTLCSNAWFRCMNQVGISPPLSYCAIMCTLASLKVLLPIGRGLFT